MNRLGNRHIFVIDKNHLPTLQEYVIASLNEETMDKLRQSEYKFLVKDHKTNNLNFRFHILDNEYKEWHERMEMIDLCPSCSCKKSNGVPKWAE